MTNVSAAQMRQLREKFSEISRLIGDDLHPFDGIIAELQRIIDGDFSEIPSSDVAIEALRQLDWYKARGFHVCEEIKRQILRQTKDFKPRPGEIPLVTGFFGRDVQALYDAWGHYTDLSKSGLSNVGFDKSVRVRIAPGMEPAASPRLVYFDPASYRGLSPENALKEAKKNGTLLAGLDAIVALIMRPQWAFEWDGHDHPHPLLSAVQLKGDGETHWSRVLCFSRWLGSNQVMLGSSSSRIGDKRWASPSVREC